VQIVEENLDFSVVSAIDEDVEDDYYAALASFIQNGDE
jgi:hypothetical protein